MRCLVLGARRYSFKDDAGELVEGVTMHYLAEPVESRDEIGYLPLSISAPVQVFRELRSLPAYADIDFRQRPGRNGRPQLVAVGLRYLGEASIGVDEASPQE